MSHVDVPIDIYITNNHSHSPPVFVNKQYIIEIPENLVLGSVAGHVQAQHSLPLVYSLVAGFEGRTNNPSTFSINELNGHILLSKALDRESVAEYRLALRAEVKDNAYLAVETVLIIRVVDINDNKPKFVSNLYAIALPENTPAGTDIVQLVATDLDKGVNGRFVYQAIAGGTAKLPFAINSLNGWLSVIGKIDREEVTEYIFDVMVVEEATLERFSDTVRVRITVLDQNDVKPLFSQNIYQTAVNEDALLGTVVTTLSANDLDTYAQSRLSYHITKGDEYALFGVRNSGDLYVQRYLDRELKAEYVLSILVTDGAFISTTTVVVAILDANDHAPVCKQVRFYFHITQAVYACKKLC